MPLPSASYTFDTLVSSTLFTYASKAAYDNISKGSILLQKLKDLGRVKSFTGSEIREPLEYALTPIYSIHYTEGVPLAPKEIITTARFTPKYLAAPLIIYNVELAMNQGEAKVFDLLEAKVRNLERSFREKVNEMLYKDGSGNNGKDLDGLAKLISASGSVGGIDPTMVPTWKSEEDTDPEPISFTKMSKMITNISWETTPDLIITTPTIWTALHDSLPALRRYDNDVKIASWGFSNFVVRGNIPVVADRYCPEGTVWFLTTQNLALRHLPGYLFQPTAAGFVPVPGADIKVQLWMLVGNMTINSRRNQGVMKNKTV